MEVTSRRHNHGGFATRIYSTRAASLENVKVIDKTVTASGKGSRSSWWSGGRSGGGPDTGFSMVGNTESSPGGRRCGGSVGRRPAGGAMAEVEDYTGVTIENTRCWRVTENNYYADTLVTPCFGLSADSNVTIENNASRNVYDFGTGRAGVDGLCSSPRTTFRWGRSPSAERVGSMSD